MADNEAADYMRLPTPKEVAADIVSAAAIHALNVPGPAVGLVDTDVLRDEIEKALQAERHACAKILEGRAAEFRASPTKGEMGSSFDEQLEEAALTCDELAAAIRNR